MFCRTCGKEVSDQAVACPGCGVPPKKGKQFCNGCGQPTNEAAEFCTSCGCKLGGAGIGNFNIPSVNMSNVNIPNLKDVDYKKVQTSYGNYILGGAVVLVWLIMACNGYIGAGTVIGIIGGLAIRHFVLKPKK